MPQIATEFSSNIVPMAGEQRQHGRAVKVLHLIAGNLYGGVETILATLANQRDLCPTMEPHFAVCFEGRISRELVSAGVPVYFLGNARISRPWTVWRARRRLQAILGEQHFDAVVCHMAWTLAAFGTTARKLGTKLVFWAHGIQNGENWLERMAKRIVPDLAIANSRFTSSSIHKLWTDVNTQVLYAPVVLNSSTDARSKRKQLRREYGVDDQTTVIIQVSRLEAWKGHRLHLSALAQLKELKNWVFWCVGGPQNGQEESYFADLQKTARELGLAERVRFLGQRSDVRDLLGAADVFCQPNESPEPFGIVFVEAMWAGLPVISTAVGGALEIIDQSCGMLIEEGNATKLAKGLRSFIESPELGRRLGQAGAARALELCDPAAQMAHLSRLLETPARSTQQA